MMANAQSTEARTPLRLGVLGCAHIAKAFIRDVRGMSQACVDAVASREPGRARSFARDNGVPRAHGSYEALLSDERIDAVYIPLPNSLHAEWAIRCAEAGKHILCEKPLALNAQEAQRMFAAARAAGVMLLEAFPWYFQPQTRDMLELLHSGAIGEVRSVQASFGFTLLDADNNIRSRPELGGGALLDAGSYPLSLIRLVMGCAPEQVTAHASWARSGVDLDTTATLLYAGGRRAQLSCSMNTATHRHAVIVGSEGVLETEYLNHTAASAGADARGFLPSLMRVRRGRANTQSFEVVQSSAGSGFRFAVEAFVRLIVTRDFEACDRAAVASLDNAATLEALARSSRAGGTAVRPLALAEVATTGQ